MSRYIPGLSYGLDVPSLYQQELNRESWGFHSRKEREREKKLEALMGPKFQGPSTAEGWLEVATLREQLGYSREYVDDALRTAETLEHDEQRALKKQKKGRY